MLMLQMLYPICNETSGPKRRGATNGVNRRPEGRNGYVDLRKAWMSDELRMSKGRLSANRVSGWVGRMYHGRCGER
jgi:hypothetical protein